MLSPSANTIFPPNPSSGGDQNYFHAGISFTIVAQSYLKIGRRDRQQGSVASGRRVSSRAKRNNRPRNISKMAILREDLVVAV